jgi:hypothetical protein
VRKTRYREREEGGKEGQTRREKEDMNKDEEGEGRNASERA